MKQPKKASQIALVLSAALVTKAEHPFRTLSRPFWTAVIEPAGPRPIATISVAKNSHSTSSYSTQCLPAMARRCYDVWRPSCHILGVLCDT